MSTTRRSSAHIITGDEPSNAQVLKRLTLLFDRIYISDIKDEAIINTDEVIEKFSTSTVHWQSRGHYPRVQGYEELYNSYLDGAENAINRQIINKIESKNVKTIDPGTHWLCYSSALSNLDLIKSAAIDASELKPEISIRDTVVQGLEFSMNGETSKYAIPHKDPVDIPNVHEDWNWISRLRVGRALKDIRIAQAINAAPIATDRINSRIVLELAKNQSSCIYPESSMIDFAINAEIVDNEKLESILLNASWKEVLAIRKHILPHVDKTKKYISKKTNIISNNAYANIEDYIEALKTLKEGLSQLHEQEAEAWESLRIGSILKAGGVVGSGTIGTIAIPSIVTLPNLLVGLVSLGLVSVGALTTEIQRLIPARRKVREHPLFFLEKISVY